MVATAFPIASKTLEVAFGSLVIARTALGASKFYSLLVADLLLHNHITLLNGLHYKGRFRTRLVSFKCALVDVSANVTFRQL